MFGSFMRIFQPKKNHKGINQLNDTHAHESRFEQYDRIFNNIIDELIAESGKHCQKQLALQGNNQSRSSRWNDQKIRQLKTRKSLIHVGLFDNELATLRKLNMSIIYLIIISTIVINRKSSIRMKRICTKVDRVVKFLLLNLKLLNIYVK